MPFQLFEESSITNASHFHRLGVTRAFVNWRQTVQQGNVNQDSPRWRERAYKVLFTKCIDPVLHPHPGITLTQCGGRDPNMAHSAMGCGCGESAHIEHRTSTNRDEVRMPIHVVALDVLVKLSHNFG